MTPTVAVRRARDDGDLATARSLEHDVFAAEGFISGSTRRVVEEYEHLDAQSSWYLVERDGEAAGVLRMIASGPSLVPALRSFDVDPAIRSELEGQRYAEVGTLALGEQHRETDTGLHLYRAAYRDSVREGVTAWVGVLEQWLLERLVSFGFPFAGMGPSRYYMGGECLPVVMLFRDVEPTLGRLDPTLHAWMTNGLPVPASA